jgi:putative ABC transport system substrate-binding protein
MSTILLLITLALGLLMAPLAVAAQSAPVPHIGVLSPGFPGPSPLLNAFQQGLRELGYVEGQTIVIEYRFAEAKPERLPTLAAELVQRKVDVILAINTPASQAVKNATKTIPIVFTWVGDPTRLVTNLSRPGANVTGLTTFTSELGGKRLQLLKEALPGLSRVAVLWNSANPNFREMEDASPKLGIRLYPLGVRDPDELPNAFEAAAGNRASALYVIEEVALVAHRTRILDLAAKHRLPTASQYREFVEAGGLLSYGPNLPDLFRRAAIYVDKILTGAKPGDLPVEQPMKFELVLNLKTAEALGLTIPPTLLVTLVLTMLAAPLAAEAQQAAKLPTIGFLGSSTPSGMPGWVAAFLDRLHERGWTEGRNVTIEYRYAEGRTERAAEAIAEFVRLPVTIIVTGSTAPVQVAKQATSVIPIVFAGAADPVGNALVASLARPGGSITGISIQQSDTTRKRLEPLRQLVPDLRRLAAIAHVASAGAMSELRQLQALAPTLGLQASPRDIRQLEDIAPAIEAFKGQAEALYVVTDPLFYANRRQIHRVALEARLLTLCNYREYAEEGCLLSYGPHIPDLWRRTADFVDKILRGTKPTDIPVEQPTTFELVINLTTAQALGLTIPPTLLFQADEVIK